MADAAIIVVGQESERLFDLGASMTSACVIVADDRESASTIPDLIAEHRDVRLVVDRLAVGDYIIDDKVVVERKTLDDFALSIIDTRVFRQAACLNRARWRPAILLEGTELQREMPRYALTGAVVSLALLFDIPVLRTLDAAESARVLIYCARQLADAPLHGGIRRSTMKPKRDRSRRRHVLASLPGIGPTIANRLLERFGTVQACMTADEDALCAIPGIGRSTARELRQLLEGRDDPHD